MYTPLDPLVDLAWFGPILLSYCRVRQRRISNLSIRRFIFLHVLGFKCVQKIELKLLALHAAELVITSFDLGGALHT